MLIVRVYPVMQTYGLKGGMLGYRGDILSIDQDIGGCDSGMQRLQSPMSNNTTVSYFSSSKQPTLPEDNSVKSQVNVVKEEDLGENAENMLTVARETNISSIQATLGLEQGRTSNVNDPDKDQINEGYTNALLLSNSQTETKQLCQIFIDRFSQNSDASSQNMNSPLDWP
eukprot:14409802-Ditylum_brightwellii.AAC.1